MTLSLIQSRAVVGLQAPTVTVEVHLANGLPSFTLVGLADVEVKEARERVRGAIQNAGLEFPQNKRITVNLAPADLPKDSGRFDLPIALGILAATGLLDTTRLTNYVFAGELSLSGQLRPVRGALALALAAQATASGSDATPVAPALVLPMANAEEAALVPHARVFGARHLLDVVHHFLLSRPGDSAQTPSTADASGQGWVQVRSAPQTQPAPYPDLADVRGQAVAKRALEIAAAGGHHVLLSGPPGCGKSMLAHRFAGLLPPMPLEHALESAAIASLVGRFSPDQWRHRRVCAPHHLASGVALVGGGCDV